MLDKNPDTVKMVFKNFPLAMHKEARKAATAALAAREQEKFWEYHDKLFENIRSLNDKKFQEIAEELGLDMEKFNADLANAYIQKVINEDISDGKQAGVRGTPTIFVNGKRVRNRSLQGFQQMIDAELVKLGKKESATTEDLLSEKEMDPGEDPKTNFRPRQK